MIALIAYGAGGALFLLLGLLHAFYTWQDGKRPRRLVPDDPAVTEAMRRAGLRLSRGETTVWRAWTGFNYSHSIGLIWFGASCIVSALATRFLIFPAHALSLPAVVGALYAWLARRYWFSIPFFGASLATALLLAGWLLA